MNKIPLLFVTVDALGRRMTREAHTPFIDFLKVQGQDFKSAMSCFPTLTTPMMTTILTGNYPNRHGINCNSRFNREKMLIEGKLRDIRCDTIADILRKSGYRTLSVQHFMLEASVDKYIQIDGTQVEMNADMIINSFKGDDYDAVFSIFQSVDHFGHKKGPLSRKTILEIEKVDRELEKLFTFFQDLWGEFLFVLTSDHSMSIADKHSGFNIKRVLKELGLSSEFYETGQSVKTDVDCVLLRYPAVSINLNSDKAIKKELEIVESLNSHPDVAVVYTKEEMDALGNADYGDIAYSLKRGYTTVPEAILRLNPFGYHGTENERDSTITFWGHGVEKASDSDAELIDVVPTCLDYLRVPFDATRFDGISRRRRSSNEF